MPPHLPAAPQYPSPAPSPAAAAYPPAAPGHPAAPGYPAAQAYPAAAPGYPAAAPTPTATGSSLGRTAFLIALIVFGINLLVSLMRPFLFLSDGGFERIGIIDGAVALVSLLGYAAALVLALIALRRAGSSLLVGIALGISGVGVIGILIGWVSSVSYRFM
jgi:hypothetical protein